MDTYSWKWDMVLYINSCVRAESRTNRLAKVSRSWFFICWSLYCLYAWQHIINDFLLDYLGVIFQKESLLETDSVGSYSDLYIFAKWYNNATLFVDYICGYFWNRTFICY